MARSNEAGLGLSGPWSARQWTYGRRQPDEIQPLALEGIRSVGKPISNWPFGTSLQGDLYESWITAVKAAQEVDCIGHVTAGMSTNTFQESGEMQMACGSVTGDPGELGRGYADRQWFD